MNKFFDTLPEVAVEMLNIVPDISRTLKISSKVEENSPDVMDIHWKHFFPILFLLLTGLITAIVAIYYEKVWSLFDRFRSDRTVKAANGHEKTNIGHDRLVLNDQRLSKVHSLRPELNPLAE